ncbi:MAG: FAD-dependent oxidoreductase [Lentisphaerae bacterium]|nr:FAD-dependent oxidoreductase [Lentisphaerota bacterium]
MSSLRKIDHEVDFCVVGGGIAGMLAAIAAARHGLRVALMHDRPVLGGNASSEIRMWICGAGSRVPYLQETGILEEIALENMHRNPSRNYSLWDALLYEKVRFEPNITLLLNCSCCQADMAGNSIASVTGFQLTTYTWHCVRAKLFADCSGDSILAPLSGAKHRIGREAKSEHHEAFGLDQADNQTMGMSLLLQARETDHRVEYIPPPWAHRFETDADMHDKPHTMLQDLNTNFYWIELGGEQDSIHDTEDIRDELLKIAFGCWDHMKNHGDHGADNWELEWVGFLPGKRESVRYVGDYIITQQDVENAASFDDEVAYGGWQIDNHLPGGFRLSGNAGAHLQKRRLSEPYGIPLRALYSANIDNLLFAGRNISATHVAFSTTRVMGTCGVMGQAIGTTAAVAIKHGLTPREAGSEKIRDIQQLLLADDCFLPHVVRDIAPLSRDATLSSPAGDASVLRNGLDRRFAGIDNGFFGKLNIPITYEFAQPVRVTGFRIIADSDLDREFITGNPNLMKIPMPLFRALSHNGTSFGFPQCLLKKFRMEALFPDGTWATVHEADDNRQRLIRGTLDITCSALRLVPLETYASAALYHTYGSGAAHLFSFEVQS